MFTCPGGRRYRTSYRWDDTWVRVPLGLPGARVVLRRLHAGVPAGHLGHLESILAGEPTTEAEVADNGDGIPPEQRDDVFYLGERGADSDGDGIGLYLASRLVQTCGSGVSVGGSPVAGAAFQVELPTRSR